MENPIENTIVIDMDGTIAKIDKNVPYEKRKLIDNITDSLRNVRDKGYKILICSHRDMQTFHGDLNKINEITKPILIKWLEDNHVPYDEIVFSKEWCGSGGHYVDDQNLHPEEFEFKFNGPFKDKYFDIVVSFFNEEKNVELTHRNIKRAERLLHINKYVYINNCSTDNTKNKLLELAQNDDKVHVFSNTEHLGYGNGYKRGFLESENEYIITNHADSQFDIYSFIYTNMDRLKIFENKWFNVFPERKNRPKLDSFLTSIVRFLISLIRLKYIREFNGHPKIIKKSDVKNDLKDFPNGFTFDLMMYLSIDDRKKIFLPVLQKPRAFGTSTWNVNFLARFKLFIKYIKFTLSTLKK